MRSLSHSAKRRIREGQKSVIPVVSSLVIMISAVPMRAATLRGHRGPTSVISGSVSAGGNVRVSALGTGKSSSTNPAGFFVLSGTNLGGRHRVTFKQGHQTFSTIVQVPTGSTISLRNTKLNNDGTAQPEQEDVEVVGTLSAIDCADTPNRVTIAPSDAGAPVVMSFDPATTMIVDESTGVTISNCSTLATSYLNAAVKAEGRQASNGSIVADQIDLNPGHGEGETSGNEVRFSGLVQSENCPASIVVQRSDSTDVTVNLGPSTEIDLEGSDQSSGACTDIPLNTNVSVEGISQADGSVNADTIEVRENKMESEGTIDSLNCSATPPSLTFTPNGSSTPVPVTIGPTTEIQVGDNESASCSDLTTGIAKIEGIAQPDGSIAASKIEQEGTDSSSDDSKD